MKQDTCAINSGKFITNQRNNTPAHNGYGYPAAAQPSQEKCHLVDPPLGHPLGDYILALLAGACAGAAAAGKRSSVYLMNCNIQIALLDTLKYVT